MVKFGIALNFAVPKPWKSNAKSEVFWKNTELAILADELGLDTVWATEHHFLQEYSHQSSPDIFFAYLAGLTKNIRFGHGIYLMLPKMNHPARVVERVAMLDIVSGGRVEFGTGCSATWTEMGGFEINPDDTHEMWEESTRAVVGMWTNEEYSQRGRLFSFPLGWETPLQSA
jgi:alkanesulfonate monooxygenase SsuD/methylene tetrahydromethanopterin reductase-like flavin-dependent oxidoreductase (luciferase family)